MRFLIGDLIVIVTKSEDKCLQKIGLQSNMPDGWRFFSDSQFERYKIAGLLTRQFKTINMYGSIVRWNVYTAIAS